ncbi:hypothetical protein [Hymenobacter gummosus]|uniref:hypothetical protein n=1 Tax=Hymenobacter gummosus TaxID=1776032 RepID=UPI001405136B|nr:hypothetical protein [Hymenobacter gummosus]
MLHALPIRNVRLSPCHEDWQQMTPTARGRHCQSCQRVVVDFTRGTAADIARAYAESPDGRVCGRFSPGQVDGTTRRRGQLRPRLRLFLAAVVLVLLQGLSAGQAWAQLQATPHVCPPIGRGFVGIHESDIPTGGMQYKAGSQQDFERLVSARLQWPLTAQGRPAGSGQRRLQVVCTVDTTGQVYASWVKGHRPPPKQQPFLDELNRVLAQLPQPFEAPNHHGRLIPASVILRFTFQRPRS